MHRLRTKQKKRGRKMVDEEQLAQERLIQISVMQENETQMNEADIFVKKLQQKFINTVDSGGGNCRSELKKHRTYNYSKQNEATFSDSIYVSSLKSSSKSVELKPPSVLTLSTIKMECSNKSQTPKNSIFNKYTTQVEDQSKLHILSPKRRQKRHMSFSLFNRIHQKCESMRTRLKKGVSSGTVQAFQINNIRLQNRFGKYIQQFKLIKS